MKLLFVQLLLIVAMPVFSQDIDAAMEIRDGDLLQKKYVAYESIRTEPSDNFVLNLKSIDIPQGHYDVLCRRVGNDTVVSYENNMRTYYRQDDNKLLICGYMDRLSQVKYDIPEIWLRYPMCKGDSVCGYFYGTGDYCHQFFVRSMGTYKTIVDGRGILILANGDTLQHVVRLRTERVSSTFYQPMESVLAEYGHENLVTPFTTDSIVKWMMQDTVPVHSVHCRWYAKGFRYPVLETIAMSERNNDMPQLTAAFYYPPEDQLSLAADAQNIIFREDYAKDSDNHASHRNLNYELIHHEFEHKLRLDCMLEKTSIVKLFLCNVQGIVCQRMEQKCVEGQNTITMNYGLLRPGQYVLYIQSGQENYIEKLNIR